MESALGMSSRMATTKKPASRRGKGLPRRAQDLSKEELLLTLQKKKECNAKALKIVEGMLEPKVKEDWFLDVLQHINQSHLQDITEERAITKLCGYPLCSNALKDVPSQQYRISTRLNKVYDIKERKNFCSNICFKANKFIRDQMHTSPLWLRDIEPVIKFSLMPSSESGGGAGDEVNVQVERVTKEEIKQLSGEELKTSQKSLADVLHGLNAVTSLQAEKSTKVAENFSNDRRKVEKDEEIYAGTSSKPYSDKATEETSSLNQEESNMVTEENKNVLTTEPSISTFNIDGSSFSKQSEVRNVARKPTVEVEYPGKVSDSKPKPPLQTVKIKEIIFDKGVAEQIDTEINYVESGNQKVKITTAPKAETHRPIVENDLKQSVTNEKKKKERQTESSSSHNTSLPIVSHVEKCLEEWFTMDTMCFLFGENALKDMLEQKGESIQSHYNALGTVTWDQEKHERFLAICKRLSLLEIEDNNFDSQVRNEGEKRKPLPDYNALKREAETMELKIKAFYSGTMEIEEKKVSFAEDTKSADGDNTNESQPQIPLVHIHSQRALRKKIVLNGLNRVLPDFLRTFGMRPSEMTASIRGLVGTFALSSTNITFKPQEWSLLGLIVIKLLTLREPELKRCLKQEQTNTYLTLMLMSYKQEPGYLEHLLSWLTDIDKLLARPKQTEEQT